MGYPASKQNLPPMMVRYLEFKDKYPDALLFFQVGDFYELFYQDAVTVAKALNLTLTSRDKNSVEPVPMCGVPLSVLDGYIDRLLPLGYSVAVVTQTGSGQGVDRVLERFVTPGMRLFTSVSSESAELIIAAVMLNREEKTAAIAFTDPQTGVLRVKDSVELAAIPRELGSLNPREVVIPRLLGGEKIDRRSAWVRGIEAAICSNAVRFRGDDTGGRDSEKGLEETARSSFYSLGPTAKRATRLLLQYMDEISLGNPLPIREIAQSSGVGLVRIDSATRANLELVRNSKDGSDVGTLFGFLNTCGTPCGSRLLRSWIVSPMAEATEIRDRQRGVSELIPYHGSILAALSGLSDLERLVARLRLRIATPKDLGAIRDVLERVPKLQDLIAHLAAPPVRLAVDKLNSPSDLTDLLSRSLVDSPAHSINEGGVIRDKFDPLLDEVRSLRFNAEEWRASFEQAERKAAGIASLKVKSNSVIGFFIEVPTSQADKVPERYQRRQSTANAERFTTPELKQYEERFFSAVDKQIKREQEIFVEIRDKASGYYEVLRTIAEGIAHIDALSALSRAAENNQWIAPSITTTAELLIDNGRHPIIEGILGGRFIPNSVNFGTEYPKCFIVTGPNMGGKSTFLRQIALITVLAQIGSYVPASSAVIGVVDRIFARLGAADDLHEGESTFMVEMREAAHILQHGTDRSLVLIDELGRGTATTDGQSLAQSILEWLTFKIGCRTLFATHYHDITLLEKQSPRIQNLSVGSIEEDDRVVFTHAIEAGPARRSYGIEVAKLSGLPPAVISRAGQILIDITTAAPSSGSRISQPNLFESCNEQHTISLDDSGLRIKKLLVEIDPDNLSPREALSMLYQLRKQID